jgi:hypothetical protein
MAPIVDSYLVQAALIGFQTNQKIVEIALLFGRSCDFGHRAFAREDHVLGMAQVGNVFGPKSALRAQDVVLELRRQIRRYRIEGIDSAQRQKVAGSARFLGVVARLVMGQLAIARGCHHHVMPGDSQARHNEKDG